MIFLFGILLCLLNPVYGVVSAPYNQYCLPNNIEMKPEHYCGASAGCQPDPPGAASMALDPADAAYAVAALHWPASDLAWGFAGTCFSLTGSRNGPWPAGVNLGSGPVFVQLYDWVPTTPPSSMSIMFDPYQTVCQPVWNISAGAWPTCYIWAQLVECPALSRLNSGNIILDFNRWNNAYTVLVSFRNSRLGIESVSLTDSSNSTPTPATRSGGVAFVVGNRQVRLPFTLQITAINGETLSVTINNGYPSANAWGPSNFGQTYSVNSNVQFTSNYNCAGSPTNSLAPTPPTGPTRAPTPAPTNGGYSVSAIWSISLFMLLLVSMY